MNRPIVCNCSLYDFTHTLSTKCRGQPYAGITKHDRLHPGVDTVESTNPYGWEPEPLPLEPFSQATPGGGVMSCEHTDHYDTSCEECRDEIDQIIARLHASVATQVSTSREPEPQVALAPAWATVRWPSHPSDVLKLLSDI